MSSMDGEESKYLKSASIERVLELDGEVGGRTRSMDEVNVGKKNSTGVLCPYYNRYSSLCKYDPTTSLGLRPSSEIGSMDSADPPPTSRALNSSMLYSNSSSGSIDGVTPQKKFPKYFLGIHDLVHIVRIGQILQHNVPMEARPRFRHRSH